MCFSAGASFGAGIVLTGIGIATIRKTVHSSQVVFSAIPLIFAVQQFAEGVLWITLPYPRFHLIQHFTTYFFILFAQVIWPLWVPIALLFVEKEGTRKMAQRVLVMIGLIVSVYLAYCLASFHVQARIDGYHIAYEQLYPPKFRYFIGLLYVIATIAPPFFSHIKRMWLLGLSILISYIITTLFYEDYLVSVWCFFSSLISLFVYIIVIDIIKGQHSGINQ